MQAIALALECVLTFRLVVLYMDSQASLDLCKFTSGIAGSDFCNKCWIEKEHIRHNKVKGHSGVVGNKCADFYANAVVTSKFFLSVVVPYHFFVVEDRSVSGNTRHVVKKLFNAVYFVGWKAKCVGSVISIDLSNRFDKARTFCVWHFDGRIGYTGTVLATLWSYFIKVFHHRLPMAKRKKMYNLSYLSVACIWCGLVKDSNHIFSCSHNMNIRNILLSNATLEWDVLLSTFFNGNAIAISLNEAASSINLYTVLAKSFVLKSWMVNTVGQLGADSDGGTLVVNFICHFAENHRFAAYYEKHNFLLRDRLPIPLVSGLSSLWSTKIIRNFGFKLDIHVCFGLHPCLTSLDFGFLCGISVAECLGV
ncbi:hypothetical protein G9A89_016519 [Geosiphon pyriformis]|nr:hypothetical protein G9A89_016519 [Geosiphon pyriformis]